MIKVYNKDLLKKRLKLTILTSTLIIGITGCRGKQAQNYTTTNGDVNITNQVTNNYNVTEYNAVKNEENNTVINNTYETNNNTYETSTNVNNILEQENTPIEEKTDKDLDVLNYFRNKVIDLEDSISKNDNESSISKCSTLITVFEDYIKGDIDICGVKYKDLKRENQQFILNTSDDLKATYEDLIYNVYSNSNSDLSTINPTPTPEPESDKKSDVEKAINDTWNQDKENLGVLRDIFSDLWNKGKEKIKNK